MSDFRVLGPWLTDREAFDPQTDKRLIEVYGQVAEVTCKVPGSFMFVRVDGAYLGMTDWEDWRAVAALVGKWIGA